MGDAVLAVWGWHSKPAAATPIIGMSSSSGTFWHHPVMNGARAVTEAEQSGDACKRAQFAFPSPLQVRHAEEAGAAAAIVYDDVYEALIIMSKPRDHLEPGIPAVFVSEKAGIIMRKLLTPGQTRVRIVPVRRGPHVRGASCVHRGRGHGSSHSNACSALLACCLPATPALYWSSVVGCHQMYGHGVPSTPILLMFRSCKQLPSSSFRFRATLVA